MPWNWTPHPIIIIEGVCNKQVSIKHLRCIRTSPYLSWLLKAEWNEFTRIVTQLIISRGKELESLTSRY